ncbi:diguanylate cyclase [Altererythrobacter arenosus]|uniref:Diguanylate cyclase n=1 Tax=Altererythrobacter arenosus TaxID=3032592 RepID=A0ABY8FW46_9SPHN|nr:sensor domain-containing diguanylate cyclase [Altererythrobacter sp. CAU 1644]WFL78952.1 diguanylate cyclase [Altererythrobacter sp. CAU 1644]
MLRGITVVDGSVLCGLLAESADDIILKLDERGFISYASPAIDQLGLRLSELLVPPHLSDLALQSHGDALRTYFGDALAGMAPRDRIEFPAIGSERSGMADRWYSLSLRAAPEENGDRGGALGVMRSIGAGAGIERDMRAVSTIDPLTGLSNRSAFVAMLSRALAFGESGSVVVFSIDRFRAVKMRYGQARADEVLWAFAQFLRSMLGEMPSLTRLEGERFAAILPGAEPPSAMAAAQETVRTFAELSTGRGRDDLALSASAGIAAMTEEVDSVLSRAELALKVASSAGGRRVELADKLPSCLRYRRSA